MAGFTGNVFGDTSFFEAARATSAELFSSSANPVGNPPVITVVSPPVGPIPSQYTPVVLDVVDNNPGVLFTILVVRYSSEQRRFVAWDGDSFVTPFASMSTVTNITAGKRYSLVPAGGWTPGVSITLDVYSVDTAGNFDGIFP